MVRNPFLILSLAGALAFASSAASAQKADRDSEKFIKSAIQGNLAEIDVGKLAQQKGKNDAVKKFGEMLVNEHGQALSKAQAAAKQVGVEPPTSTSIMQKATYAKLKLLSGDTFDRSFASTMVSDHEKEIKEYQKASAKSGPVGQYAKETLPALQKHLQTAKQLQSQVSAKK
jgi:putative membrane protein